MHAARMQRGPPWSRTFLCPLLLKISLSAFQYLGQSAYTDSVHLQVIFNNTSLLSPVAGCPDGPLTAPSLAALRKPAVLAPHRPGVRGNRVLMRSARPAVGQEASLSA